MIHICFSIIIKIDLLNEVKYPRTSFYHIFFFQSFYLHTNFHDLGILSPNYSHRKNIRNKVSGSWIALAPL